MSSNNNSVEEFSEDEAALVARMYNLLGKRWTMIAGRIPGKTAEEIERYFTSRISSSENHAREFSEDEELIIARMFKMLGKRWALIAGRIPGRNAEEIKHYWTSKNSSQTSVKEFSEAEEALIARMIDLVGERWHLIAGRIPGRTPEQIKYWSSKCQSTV